VAWETLLQPWGQLAHQSQARPQMWLTAASMHAAFVDDAGRG